MNLNLNKLISYEYIKYVRFNIIFNKFIYFVLFIYQKLKPFEKYILNLKNR